jgi:O-antigen/teichoic acid export membrane protein
LAVSLGRVVADASLARWLLGEWSWPGWSSEGFSRLRSFAGWTYANSVVATISGMADRFLITGFIGAGELGYYGTAQRFMSYVHGGLSSVTQTLFPTFSEAGETLPDMIRRRSWAMAWLLGLGVAAAYGAELLVAPFLLGRLVGASFLNVVWPFVALFAVYGVALGFDLFAWYLSLGAGQPRINTLLSAGYAAVTIPAMFVAVRHAGALGVGVVQVMMVGNAILHLYWVRRAVVRDAAERPWASLRAALVPFAVPSGLAVIWTALSTLLVLKLRVRLGPYTVIMCVAIVAGLAMAVWREYARRSERYELAMRMLRAGWRLLGAAGKWANTEGGPGAQRRR